MQHIKETKRFKELQAKCSFCGGEVTRMMSDHEIYTEELTREIEHERLEALRDELEEEADAMQMERIERERKDTMEVNPIFGAIFKTIDKRK